MIDIFFLLTKSFSRSVKFLVSLSFNNIFPFEGLSNNANKCKNDDLPEPEGPTRATRSPALILTFTLLKSSITPFL